MPADRIQLLNESLDRKVTQRLPVDVKIGGELLHSLKLVITTGPTVGLTQAVEHYNPRGTRVYVLQIHPAQNNYPTTFP